MRLDEWRIEFLRIIWDAGTHLWEKNLAEIEEIWEGLLCKRISDKFRCFHASSCLTGPIIRKHFSYVYCLQNVLAIVIKLHQGYKLLVHFVKNRRGTKTAKFFLVGNIKIIRKCGCAEALSLNIYQAFLYIFYGF